MNPRNAAAPAALAPVALAAVAALAACSPGPRVLDVYVWSGYLDPGVVTDFEREAGCTVVESNYDSNEELRAKLQAGAQGWDLVCPTDYAVVQLAGDGLLAQLRHENLPNLRNLGERFRRPAWDPDLRWSVPFQWGVTGIGYDPTKADPPPTSWADLFDPARAETRKGRFTLLRDGREVMGAALLSLGFSPNSRDRAQVAAARERCLRLKPFVLAFDSDDPAATLAQGQTVMAQGWSGNFANAAAESPNVAFVVPKEGALAYVDNWAVPKGAADQDLAERFVDFLLRADVAARLVERRLYASCNEAANGRLPAEIRGGMAYADGGGVPLHRVEDVGDLAQLYADAWRDLQTE
jgi:spermidine/putrescine transport system substrate-binding protein